MRKSFKRKAAPAMRPLVRCDIPNEEWKTEYAVYLVNGEREVFSSRISVPVAVIQPSGVLAWTHC